MISKWRPAPPKFITLACRWCKCNFDYPTKEHTRQTKKRQRGQDEFYCSLSCARKWKNANDPRKILPREHYQRISALASAVRLSRSGCQKYGSFAYYLRNCRRRQQPEYPIDLDEEYLHDLWGSQNGRCAISGIPLLKRTFNTKKAPNIASLDRIDSSVGYMKGNVQFVAYSLNLAKQDFSAEEFSEFYDLLIEEALRFRKGSQSLAA